MRAATLSAASSSSGSSGAAGRDERTTGSLLVPGVACGSLLHRLAGDGDIGRCRHLSVGRPPGLGRVLGTDLGGDLLEQFGALLEKVPDVLTTLAQAHLAIAEPGTALLHHPRLDGHVEDAARVGDALVVEDVELGGPERRGHLVLDNLDLDSAADDVEALLDGLDAADVHAHRGIELQ